MHDFNESSHARHRRGPRSAGQAVASGERERLVDELLASLNEPTAEALDAAWSAEIERRLAAYDRGEVQARTAEEVFAKARAYAK